MKLGTQTGSLFNHLYGTMTGTPAPAVGMGATVLCWTDRKAGTIIKAEPDVIVVQLDTVTRTDGYGMSDCQSYSYAPNPTGSIYIFRKVSRGKAKGQWRERGSKDGNGLLIGDRREYHDYSF